MILSQKRHILTKFDTNPQKHKGGISVILKSKYFPFQIGLKFLLNAVLKKYMKQNYGNIEQLGMSPFIYCFCYLIALCDFTFLCSNFT